MTRSFEVRLTRPNLLTGNLRLMIKRQDAATRARSLFGMTGRVG
jgi:hypothetical protein